MLTDNRVIEVAQLRPIDQLAMLLHVMADTRGVYAYIETFEELMDIFSVRETCSMLLQIIIERDTVFTFSRKQEESYVSKRKREVQHATY